MRSLRQRLTFTHALVALVAVVIVATLATALIRRGFDRLADRQAALEADNIVERLAELYQTRQNLSAAPQVLVRQLNRIAPIQRRRLQLFDAQGVLIFDSAGPPMRGVLPMVEGVVRPIIVNGQTVGTIVLAGQRSDFSPAERDFITRIYLSMLLGSLLAGIVALAVGLLITERVTRPLRSLKMAVQRLASGTRHEPLPPPPDTELAELALAFNTMAAELEHQQVLRRNLVADIAHELRTPLSILRLQLESLEDGVEEPTPVMLGSLTEEVGLLTRLVDDLRLLSLADAGQLSLTIDALDVDDVLARAMTTAAARARQQGVSITVERCPQPLTVIADGQRLAQILGNVIENALRYTPTGGQVTIRARLAATLPQTAHTRLSVVRGLSGRPQPPDAQPQNTPPMVVFEIVDTGAGIPAHDLPYIFERFYRTDKARARETGGSGLGLAIVQRLAEMQGGHVWVTSVEQQGATFSIALPSESPKSVVSTRPQALPQQTHR